MTIRMDPEIKKLILEHPKGARAYVESLVKDAPKLQGQLAVEKTLLMQERQAHRALQQTQSRLLKQQKILTEALQQIAAASPGPASQLAEQALYEAHQIPPQSPQNS